MKVVIVEDDFIVADHLKMILEKHNVKVLGTVDSVTDAMESIDLKPDLYFIDIRLVGDKTGIDLGFMLKDERIPFVYLSANNEMKTVKSAAKTAPLTYITKPYNEIDIVAVIELYKEKHGRGVEVKTHMGKKTISINAINFVESEGSYVKIHTGEEVFSERNSLNEWEDKFAEHFIRVHRSFLVNKNKITEYNSSHVFLAEIELPLSRKYKSRLKSILKE